MECTSDLFSDGTTQATYHRVNPHIWWSIYQKAHKCTAFRVGCVSFTANNLIDCLDHTTLEMLWRLVRNNMLPGLILVVQQLDQLLNILLEFDQALPIFQRQKIRVFYTQPTTISTVLPQAVSVTFWPHPNNPIRQYKQKIRRKNHPMFDLPLWVFEQNCIIAKHI